MLIDSCLSIPACSVFPAMSILSTLRHDLIICRLAGNTSRRMSNSAQTPVKLVLFDVFGQSLQLHPICSRRLARTLLTAHPARHPMHTPDTDT
jgi:hypothetical protein